MIKSLFVTMVLSGLLMAQSIYATFDVNADREANLMLSSSGLIKKIYVDVGDHVKQGELLLELDNYDLKTSVILAQKKISLAKLNLKYAKKAFKRFEKVKDVVDEGKYDAYVSKYETAQLELAKAKINLRYKQAILDKTRLKAPFSGVIAQKFVEEGDGVSGARMNKLFTLIDEKKQILKVMIDEKHWKRVKNGQSFSYSLDGSDEKYIGKVAKIYPAIDTKKRAITLEVLAKGLKVGLFGHGYLKVD